MESCTIISWVILDKKIFVFTDFFYVVDIPSLYLVFIYFISHKSLFFFWKKFQQIRKQTTWINTYFLKCITLYLFGNGYYWTDPWVPWTGLDKMLNNKLFSKNLHKVYSILKKLECRVMKCTKRPCSFYN